MKHILITLLIIITIIENSFSQIEYYDVTDNKQIYYYDAEGIITLKSQSKIALKTQSQYYRKLDYPPQNFPFDGLVTDYTMNNTKTFSGKFINGLLEGSAQYFYENGNLKIKANYKQGKRNDVWEYYYPDGKIEKRIKYSNDSIFVIDYFNKKGKHLVIDGNGTFRGKIYVGAYKLEYVASGKIENYQLNGNWKMNTVTEKYENGKLIRGNGMIASNFFNILVNENVDIFRSIAYTYASELNKKEIDYQLQYGEELKNEYSDFIQLLNVKLTEKSKINQTEIYWLLMSFNIGTNNKLIEYQIDSNLDEIKQFAESILLETYPLRENYSYSKEIKTSMYLPIVFIDGNVIIPRFSIFVKNKE